MSHSPSSKPVRQRIFHGWWIVMGTWVQMSIQSSFVFLSFGAYVDRLEIHFGWSRTAIAGAFSLSRIESGLLGPLQGYWVDRYGPMRIIWIGSLLTGVGFLMMAAMQNIVHFYIAFLIVAIGGSLGGFLTLNTSVANWFIRKRAQAMGIAQTGLGFGGVIALGIAWLLDSAGWRWTFIVAGIVLICVGVPISRLFVHRPEDRGQLPDGRVPSEQNEPALGSRGSGVEFSDIDFTLREAMRDPSFWLISLGHGTALLVVSSMQVHLIPHLTDIGWSLVAAGAMVPVMTLVSIIGQLSGGFLGDRYSKRGIAAACMLGHASGMVLLALSQATPMIFLAVVLHAIAWGARGPLMTAIRADYYGRRNFAKVMGTSSLVVQLGTLSGPLIAGAVFDATGAYTIAFLTLGTLTGMGTLFFLLARRPPAPARYRR